MEDSTGKLKRTPKGQSVAQVAIVGNRQLALQMIYLNGLAVAHSHAAGGTIADMTDGDLPIRKILHFLMGKDFIDKADSMVGGEHAVVIDNDAAAFLTTVLQGIETVIGQGSHIGRLWTVYAKNAAFFMNTHLRPPKAAAMKPTNRGWGLLGRLLNSGWNCTPTWKGRSVSSTVSTSRLSGEVPLSVSPAFVNRSR